MDINIVYKTNKLSPNKQSRGTLVKQPLSSILILRLMLMSKAANTDHNTHGKAYLSFIFVEHTHHKQASSWCMALECRPGRSEPAAPGQALGDPAGSLPHKPVCLSGRQEAGEPLGESWWTTHLRGRERYQNINKKRRVRPVTSGQQLLPWHLLAELSMLDENVKRGQRTVTCSNPQLHSDCGWGGVKRRWKRLIHHMDPHFTWRTWGWTTLHHQPMDKHRQLMYIMYHGNKANTVHVKIPN